MTDRFPMGARIGVQTTEPVGLLDYLAPEGGVSVGELVVVPLGPRRVMGVVRGPGAGDFDAARLRPVQRRIDAAPLGAGMLEFLDRAADYTLTPPPVMLRMALRAPDLDRPPAERRVIHRAGPPPARMTDARAAVLRVLDDHGGAGFAPAELAQLAGVGTTVVRGLVAAGTLVATAAPVDLPYPRLDPGLPGKALDPAQTAAAEALRAGVRGGAYGATLLRGVTGSGKTEVYLEAVAETLRAGRQALVLLPEIALSAEFLDRVEARFGARPGEWHSGITRTERRRLWHMAGRGEVGLVVGARSALFLPFRDLGLIVVDEEHDSSYKQDETVYYNARDMAVLRASIEQAQVVLASATPSVESWVNAASGKYARLDLRARYGEAELPQMAAIDLRAEEMPSGSWISPTLAAAVDQRIGRGEQALMFLNRRGYAPITTCRACGHQVGCDDCDARMVEHRFQKRLVCHQCGATKPVPTACPACGVEGRMAAVGPGVERLAEEVAARFPGARAEVLSSDLFTSARAVKESIARISGGGERPGLALLQTHQPEHPVIRAILSGEDEAFWDAEAAARRAAQMPPFSRLAGIILSHPDQPVVEAYAAELARRAAPLREIGAELFGPAPAPIARVRARYRVRMLIRAPRQSPIQAAIAGWLAAAPKAPSNLRLAVDIDPQSFL
ncbi:primosomal protein N' [Paracoccus sanguinis]|uniref:replication restart helicase PriA n=1 Tax=Paracoccus sanguinis TaxID=1545044 RepID=UPI00051D12C6|nr:primosomal protein N' [Paracoccus sanguinis]KGJ18020.1 primosome assembly protein PriA [Paracoccus sanguinis]